jgi:hypothetical protein
VRAGVGHRFAPHRLCHAHAVVVAREGVRLNVIHRQLGHTTSASPRCTWKASTMPRSSSGPRAPRAHGPGRRSLAALTAATATPLLAHATLVGRVVGLLLPGDCESKGLGLHPFGASRPGEVMPMHRLRSGGPHSASARLSPARPSRAVWKSPATTPGGDTRLRMARSTRREWRRAHDLPSPSDGLVAEFGA